MTRSWMRVLAAATAAAGVILMTSAADQPKSAAGRRDFWEMLRLDASEVFTPESVDAMVAASDAVVVGRVTDVVADREPRDGSGISTAYLTVVVDDAIAGPAARTLPERVSVRVLKPPSASAEELRSANTAEPAIFFIEDLAAAVRSGGHPVEAETFAGKWRLVSVRGVLVDSPAGIAVGATNAPESFLLSAGGGTVMSVAARIRNAFAATAA